MNNNFQTKDLYLAAYLYSAAVDKYRGAVLHGRVYWFQFQDSERLQQFITDYWSERAECNVRKYTNAIRSLKDIVLS